MDPEERQRQRDARRRARQEKTDDEPEDTSSRRRSSAKAEAVPEPVQESSNNDDEERLQREREEQEQREREEQEKRNEDRRQQEEQRRREVDEERKRKDDEAKQRDEQEKEQEAKKQKKQKPKKKGLGGLSPEKKRQLKQLIMQKAAEEMIADAKKRQEEKENYLKNVVPKLEIDTDNKDQMSAIVKKLYEKLCQLEGEKYDWEVKIRNVEYEINDMSLKVNNVKGKFVKPVLKRVSKNEGKWAKIQKSGPSHSSFRDQLKSTGQNKYALEDKEEEHKSEEAPVEAEA